MSLQDVIILEPQLTARPGANMRLASLVPTDVGFQLASPLESSVTPRFLALVAEAFLLYTAEFPH
jgi:hypothetical protein